MNINSIRMFIKVVEAGNFMKASNAYDIPRATLSRNIKQLEDDLGVLLIERNTRSHQLTESGELFYVKVKSLINDFDDLEKEVSQETKQLSGRITFAMPSFLFEIGAQDMTTFQESYPNLEIFVKTLEGGIDPSVDKGFNLAVQVDYPSDSSFILVPIAELSFNYFCSKQYLAQHKDNISIDNLATQKCIYSPINNNEAKVWHFGSRQIKPKFSTYVDSHLAAASFAAKGMGICCIPTVISHEKIFNYNLVPLFNSQYQFKKLVYAIYPSKRHMPTKLKILLERLKTTVQEVINQYESEVLLQN